jgi:hypothetical protein
VRTQTIFGGGGFGGGGAGGGAAATGAGGGAAAHPANTIQIATMSPLISPLGTLTLGLLSAEKAPVGGARA